MSFSTEDLPKGYRYTKTHEWAKIENNNMIIVGITDFAQAQLADITYVELPEIGRKVHAEEEVGVVESVKAASDVYAPLSGEIVAINNKVDSHPKLINTNPYDDGWLFKIKPDSLTDLDDLLSSKQYEELLPQEDKFTVM